MKKLVLIAVMFLGCNEIPTTSILNARKCKICNVTYTVAKDVCNLCR